MEQHIRSTTGRFVMTVDVTLSGDLFESFLLDSWDALGQFEAAIFALQTNYGEESLSQLAVLSHRMRGTTALYGFSQMSRLAALAERLLEFKPDLGDGGRAGLIAFLERLAVCLRGALERVSLRRGEGDLGLQFTEIGGTALLRRLLQDEASAFAPRAAGARSAQSGDLNADLSAFRREHADVWEYFAPEAREHIDLMRAALDSGDFSGEAVTTLFRSAHTLKGSSYMVGFTALGDLGHLLEDVLSAAREGRLQLDGGVALTLAEGVDLGERFLRAAEGEAGDLSRVTRHTRRKLLALLGQEAPEAAPEPQSAPSAPSAPAATQASVRVPVEKLDALMNLTGELIVARGRLTYQLSQLSEMGQLLARARERMERTAREFEEKYLNPHLAESEAAQDGDAARQASTQASVQATVQELFDELEFDSYNDLNIVARSVSEISADLTALQGELEAQVSALGEQGETVSKLARTLRGEVARARRVPFGQALTRLKRWARTREGGKPFTLDLSGDAVEVDTFVLEAVVDPLLHLVNNALAHGLEDPGVRAARGKSPEGRIGVRAVQTGAFLELEVRDDGAGIDLERVREKARSLMPEAELARMTPNEVTDLIFLPGLSTAPEVSADAGRGVGMDVVASNVRRLGGEVLVRSQTGVGTTFTLRVPLTQQITETLVFRVGAQLAAFPTTLVRALRSVPSSDLAITDDGEKVLLEGDLIRLYRLRDLWGLAAPHTARGAAGPGTITAAMQPEAPKDLSVIVVESAGRRLAVAVDEFLGLEELAVRGAGRLLAHVEYLSGTTLSSAGDVVLVLDPQGVERLAQVGEGVRPTRAASVGVRTRRLLLVDDSVSVRRIVARMLERGGFTVVTAPDGYEALELLRADADFDAVLTDLEMPRVSGYELIEEVRRRAGTRDLPIVVMTTRAGDKHQQLALSLGASEYFSKPIDEARLVRRLHDLTSGATHSA